MFVKRFVVNEVDDGYFQVCDLTNDMCVFSHESLDLCESYRDMMNGFDRLVGLWQDKSSLQRMYLEELDVLIGELSWLVDERNEDCGDIEALRRLSYDLSVTIVKAFP